MADSVIDIVAKLTYETEDKELKEAGKVIGTQIGNIRTLENALANLESKLRATSRFEIQERRTIIAAINNTRTAINNQNRALEQTILNNRQIQQEVSREIGLIGRLNQQMERLRQVRDISNDPTQIREYNRQLSVAQGQLTALNSNQSRLGQLGSGIIQGLGVGAGIGIAGLAATGVAQISQFIQRSSELAAETEGVKRAFEALNQPDLLSNLRDATKGTVSDLELMKQAVQFNNFGLPLDQLATGLQFARRRAAETGQSVEYLVQSIVTGIGRQSPLILDNLGINAKRVSEEFKRTGDFAQAAFNIIGEEIEKSGKDLTTYAEQIARINAEIENQQAALGVYVNEAKGYFSAVAQDIFNTFSGRNQEALLNGSKTILAQYKSNLEEKDRAEEISRGANIIANNVYLDNYKSFINQYVNADFKGREEIRANAERINKSLLDGAADYAQKSLLNLEELLLAEARAYQRFTQQIAKIPVNLNTLTPGGLSGLTREQLQEVQGQIGNARNGLTSRDTADINRLNKLGEAVTKQLNTINGVVDKTGLKSAKAASNVKELRERLDELARKTFTPDDEDALKYLSDLEAQAKETSRVFQTEFGKIRDNFDLLLLNETFGFTSTDTTPESRRLANQLETQRIEKQNKKLADDKKKEVKERRSEAEEAAFFEVQTAVNALQAIYDMRLFYLDREASLQQTRIEQATELARRGNTEQLRIEEERLNRIQAERERIAKRQLVINAAIQASNQAVALSEAIGAVVKAASQGDPYTIALRVAAAVAALVAGIASISSAFQSVNSEGAFKDGVVDYKGRGTSTSDSNWVRISRGESVITAAATQQYAPVLKAMNEGTPLFGLHPKFISPSVGGNGYASRIEMKGLERKLDGVIDAVKDNRFRQDVFFNEHGVGILTQKAVRRERNKWKH